MNQEELQQKLVNNFLNNMSFFKSYDIKLYLELEALSQLINNNECQERYSLEYIEEEEDFDIYDKEKDYYLYDRKPKYFNKKLVDKIKTDNTNLILFFEDELLKKYEIKDFSALKQNVEDIKKEFLIQSLTKYTQVLGYTDKITPKKIEKFVFFGTLLGTHIESVVKKINSYIYMVFEQNLEIFRLSLFTIDYSVLAKRGGVIFSIGEDSYVEKIKNFLSTDFVNNSIIKFSNTYLNTSTFRDIFLSTIISKKSTTYDFNRILYTNLKNSVGKWNREYPKLLFKKLENKFDYFKDKRVLYLAGGPSLEKNILWIKKNQDKFIIATIGATYAYLLKNDIKVDLIFTLDGMYEFLIKKQFSQENIDLLKDEIIFASMITDDRIIDKFNKENLFLYENSLHLDKSNFDIPSSSVGEMGLAILLLMNIKKLYLIGLDMALDQNTGLSHSQSSGSGIIKADMQSEKIGNSSSLDNELVVVKGNLIKEVKTNIKFKFSIECINEILEGKKSDVNIYNLSSNGAYFINTKAIDIKDLNLDSFKDTKFSNEIFKKELEFFVKQDLSENIRNNFIKEADYLEEILNKDLNSFLKSKSKTFEKFISENNTFFSKLMSQEESIHSKIFSNYFNILLNFLSLKFNDKNIKNERDKLKSIKKIMKNDIENMIKDIIFYLKSIK